MLNPPEDTSVVTLGRNQKSFALNYILVSLSEEVYQSSSLLPDASPVGRQPAFGLRVMPIRIISTLICPWGMNLRSWLVRRKSILIATLGGS